MSPTDTISTQGTDVFGTQGSDVFGVAGRIDPVSICAQRNNLPVSSRFFSAESVSKVVTIYGAFAGKLTVPFAPQKEAQRQQNLLANRGSAARPSTVQESEED